MKTTKKVNFKVQSVISLVFALVIAFTAMACISAVPVITYVDGDQVIATVEAGKALDESMIPEAPEKEGAVFEGWFVNGVKVEVGATFSESVTANAVYTTLVTVTLKNGDEVLSSNVVKPGSAIGELPTLEEEGKVFKGWFVNGKQIDAEYVVNESVEVLAVFCEEFVVDFTIEGEKVASIVVESGNKIGELPFPTQKPNHAFAGWFVGENKINAEYVPTASVVADAKYVEVRTVSFVVEGSTVKTVSVEKGKTINVAKIPEDPKKENYAFMGWYNGEELFTTSTVVNEDLVLTASFRLAKITVDFVAEGQTTTVTVEANEEGAFILGASNIPANPAIEGSVFFGWYNGLNKIEAGSVVENGMVLTAFMVNQASYEGIWVNEDLNKFVVGEDVEFNEDSYGTWNYDPETAQYISRSYNETYTATRTIDGVHIYYYDYGMDRDENYYLTAYEGTSPVPAGTYTAGRRDVIVVEENGLISSFNGSTSFYWADIKATEEGIVLTYVNSSYGASNPTHINFTLDEKGNLVSDHSSYGGIYVVANEAHFYNGETAEGDNAVISEYATANGKVIVYSVNNEHSYATVSGALLVGGQPVLTVNGEKIYVRITEGSFEHNEEGEFVFRGAEYGTYTGAMGDIVLDGFGKASIGTEYYSCDYYVANGVLVIQADDEKFGFDLAEGAYTVKESDGFAGLFYRDGNNKYSVELDGFGTIIDSYIGSYSSNVYYNLYTVNGSSIQITITGASYDYNVKGTLSVEDNGNVLIYKPYSTAYVYVKEGVTIEDKTPDFVGETNGLWADAEGNEVVVNTDSKKITYQGNTISYTANYNHSVITFSAIDPEDAFGNKATYTVTVVDGALVIVHQRAIGLDEYGEYPEFITVTETFAPKAAEEADGPFSGTWEGAYVDIVFVDSSTLTYDGTQYNYTVTSSGVLEFSNGYYDFEGTINSSGRLVLTYFDWDMYEEYSLYFDKVEENEGPYSGTWNPEVYGLTIEFIDGSTLYYGATICTYEVSDSGVISFSTEYYDFEGSINSYGKLVLDVVDWTMGEEYVYTYVKA